MEPKDKEKILNRINSLPKGSISVKTINGRKYEYWQFRENGRQVSRRVKGIELETLSGQIEERKRLEEILRSGAEGGYAGYERQIRASEGTAEYRCVVRTGKALSEYAAAAKGYRKRNCFKALSEFIYGPRTDRVFILYGLRRTGKTTMIRQMILDMSEEMLGQTAFLQMTPRDDMNSLNRDLTLLEKQGYRYIFIDEVTLLDDFIEGAALFSDVFAASGIKIVLSGTDSLGFLFSEDDQLYDRCLMQHTTFISYKEFENVLGIKGVDEYVRYGGTMSLSGRNYNADSTFATETSTNEYIDSAIAGNIQHSLKNYRYGGHFRDLQELYDSGELTNAINRVVEDMNHRFTREVITGTFKSHDLGISRNNLRRQRELPDTALDDIDTEAVTQKLMDLLDIVDKENQKAAIREEHAAEIGEYLELLDLVKYAEVVNAVNVNKSRRKNIITQPGLRYAQAEALISALLRDDSFRSIGLKQRTQISDRIMSEIKGRMMEDIVLLETKLALPDMQVFVLKFAVGEFDMVVFDPRSASCRIYEIKHSEDTAVQQRVHLTDPSKCEETEKQYGDIKGRYVIYRGESKDIDGIRYINVEEYLCSLTE